jgi:hypothetical protein
MCNVKHTREHTDEQDKENDFFNLLAIFGPIIMCCSRSH